MGGGGLEERMFCSSTLFAKLFELLGSLLLHRMLFSLDRFVDRFEKLDLVVVEGSKLVFQTGLFFECILL